MGFATAGRVMGGYNTANEQLSGAQAEVDQNSGGFLKDWITNKLPDLVTGLAVRVVDDGSGTIAKEVLDAGTDQSFIGGLFK